MEGSGRGTILRHYSGIFLAVLRKTTKYLSQDSRSPRSDFNLGPLEYKGVLTTQPQRSAIHLSAQIII
jgi:hypothetical protein